ncbi:DUF6508 domain-containing protein [Brachybacterium tyrofermentans]|uniref:DUF6508 domain-containing protein n=1 Tax=Brachybacterium tyrofermentans TaxID=47848 RepID=UPI003FCF7071
MNRQSDLELVGRAVDLWRDDPRGDSARGALRQALSVAHERLAGPDYEYMDHMHSLDRADIPTADLADVSTWCTWVVRGERFSDGHIDANIRDGLVAELMARLLDVIEVETEG